MPHDGGRKEGGRHTRHGVRAERIRQVVGGRCKSGRACTMRSFLYEHNGIVRKIGAGR